MPFLRHGLGNFRCCIWKEKFASVYVRWRGMVRCGAFAPKARKSMVVETSFAGALVCECTDLVRRTSLRAHRCCKVVAWLYLDLGISRKSFMARQILKQVFAWRLALPRNLPEDRPCRKTLRSKKTKRPLNLVESSPIRLSTISLGGLQLLCELFTKKFVTSFVRPLSPGTEKLEKKELCARRP